MGRFDVIAPSMENTVTVQPVNWEAVRALALVVGVRESARRMGISEEAVKKRCTREGWLASPEAKRANQNAIAQRSGLTAPVSPHLSPGALISAELAQLGSKTRLSLARGVAKATETIENMQGTDILEKSSDVKNIAQTADLVHGWKDSAPQVKIRLDVLNAAPAPQIMDVECELLDELSASEDTDNELDSY